MSLLHRKRSLFQRLMLLGLMALVLSTALTLTTGVASAHTSSSKMAAIACFNTGCDGRSPVKTQCDFGATTHYTTYSSTYGEHITIRYSVSCGAAWALVWFDHSLPANTYGNGVIERTSDNKKLDCATGNGVVLPGQSSCYTGMLGDLTTTSWGFGLYESANTGWLVAVRTYGAY